VLVGLGVAGGGKALHSVPGKQRRDGEAGMRGRAHCHETIGQRKIALGETGKGEWLVARASWKSCFLASSTAAISPAARLAAVSELAEIGAFGKRVSPSSTWTRRTGVLSRSAIIWTAIV
jgi:hypothetical protein